MKRNTIIAVIAVAVLAGMLLMLSGCTPDAGGDNKPGKDINENKSRDIIDDDRDGDDKAGQDNQDAGREDEKVPETPGQDRDTVPSLGGVSLGDSAEDTVKVLGNDYAESAETDASGLIGEDMAVREYRNGITVYIGKTSGKVLRIISESDDFKTDLGVGVGDDAKTVSDTYGSRFEKAVSRHIDEELEGWYLLEDGSVIIFDFDRTDDTLINSDVKPDSKVGRIVLAYWQHFD